MNTADTVVIIGGSSGIGLAVAHRCLADGAEVVIAGRSPARLDAASAELGCPERVTAVAADIGDRAQVESLFDPVRAVSHLVVTAADLPYGAGRHADRRPDHARGPVQTDGTLAGGPAGREADHRDREHHVHLRRRRAPARPGGLLAPRSTARSKPWSGRWRWN